MNQYAIELQKGQQPPYGPIYSLGPVDFETLKTYIKTNLANSFIRPSKPPTDALILFVRKPDGFPHPIRPFQISSDAVWSIQYSGELLGLHQ